MEILKSLGCNGQDLNSVSDSRVSDFCELKYQELIDTLVENSREYEDENYREECLIDPDSDEYDPEGDEEQFDETFEEWWLGLYDVGVRITEDFDKKFKGI